MSELVTDYLDRSLPWHLRIKARVHLFLCGACTRYYDQMRRTIGLLAGGPRHAPPADVENQVLQALAEHPSSTER
jgi:predicted anti-sigma-YlaC factor YlaD